MWVAQAMWWVAQAMWWEGCAGYVVDYTPIIKPLRGPTCMLKTSKISTQVEIASWARVWQYIGPLNQIFWVLTTIKNPILFCKFLSPLKSHRNGFVFKIYIWISVFRRKKRFENPMLGCREICKINMGPFFWNTLYLGLIAQPAVAGARSLADRKLKIYLHKGMVRWMKWDIRPALAVYLPART